MTKKDAASETAARDAPREGAAAPQDDQIDEMGDARGAPREGAAAPKDEQIDIGDALQGLLCSTAYMARLGVAFLAANTAYHLLGIRHNEAVNIMDGAFVSALSLLAALSMALPPRMEPPHLPDNVKKTFRILSGFEIVLTVLLPLWILGSEPQDGPPSPCGLLLTAHLFVFLSQIFIESLIASAGKGRRYLLLPVALSFNIYRAYPLWNAAVATLTLLNSGERPALCLFCHAASVALWVFSTFFFIVGLWLPNWSFPELAAKSTTLPKKKTAAPGPASEEAVPLKQD